MLLVRHGESEFNVRFNVTRIDPGIPDPRITDRGREQAHSAARLIAEMDHEDTPERIIASPYCRTLETAHILSDILSLPVEVDAGIGEHAHFTCDIGTPVSRLAMEWPHIRFDHLDEVWWPEREEDHHVDARSRLFRERMSGDPKWRHTIVVSHWGFIRALTGMRLKNCGIVRLDPTAPHPTGATVVTGADSC